MTSAHGQLWVLVPVLGMAINDEMRLPTYRKSFIPKDNRLFLGALSYDLMVNPH